MPFDTHVFISYGHTDNVPTPDEPGWVTRFQGYLSSFLAHDLKEMPRIWRDERLTGNEVFSDEIQRRLEGSAAVIAMVSPRYAESSWCLREAEAFCRAAEQHGGLIVNGKARLFPVMMKPLPEVERKKLPGRVSEMLGYPFYVEVEGGRHERLDPSMGSPEIFKRRIARLAADIAEVVERVMEAASETVELGPRKPAIYLAECSFDRIDDRERLWGELTSQGYTVLPEQPSLLPDVEPHYVEEVSGLLGRCALSIHLIGAYGGKTPDGPSRKPVVELQNELAALQSAQRGLTRIIWLPEGTPAENWAYPEELHRSGELQRGADLITGGVEDLMSAVRSALKSLERTVSISTEPEPEHRSASVYVVCIEEDIEALGPLLECLVGQGYDIQMPVFVGSATAVRESNEATAMACDAAILFCGAGDGAWMRQQQNELRRVQALRRERPLKAVFTYLSAPLTPDKRVQKALSPSTVLDGLAGFTESALEPLLRAAPPAPREVEPA